MLDRDRILAKIDGLNQYLRELEEIVPQSFSAYLEHIEKRRACERLLQISIESVIDICQLFVSGLRLGLPANEDDLFEKLEQAKLISSDLAARLRSIKGFRNILVHEYGGIDNAIVYKVANTHVQDLERFMQEILRALREKHVEEDH